MVLTEIIGLVELDQKRKKTLIICDKHMKKVYVIKVYEKGYDKGIRLVYDMDKDVTGFSCTWHPTWIIQRLRE